MRRPIFVDLGDVLGETVATLLRLLERLHGRRLALDDVSVFDLERAFGLDASTWEEFMRAAHADEVLLEIAPRPGAARVLRRWSDAGHPVAVVTGRPPSTEALSRRWLEHHAIPHHDVHFVDKYGRPDWRGGTRRALPLEEVTRMSCSLVVEDSLGTAAFMAERLRVPVALLDRPWNRDERGLSEEARGRITRCADWEEVEARFPLD